MIYFFNKRLEKKQQSLVQFEPGSAVYLIGCKSVPHNLNTIYWNPQSLTDNNGIATFQFNNGLKSGTNRVVIEGMNYDGSLVRKVYMYEIKN